MLAERLVNLGIGRMIAGVLVAILSFWNIGLVGALVFGPSDVPTNNAVIDKPAELSARALPSRELIDLTPARAKPLFSESRRRLREGPEEQEVPEQLVTAPSVKTERIEFRGVIARQGTLFAVCQTAEGESIGLYKVGDDLMGGRVIEISREKLVIEVAGQTSTFLLSRSSEEDQNMNIQIQRPTQAGSTLIIGPGQL